MHTFERIENLLVQQRIWCWSQHGDISLQSAARTGFERSRVCYRYVCILWRPWTHIVFYDSIEYDKRTAG